MGHDDRPDERTVWLNGECPAGSRPRGPLPRPQLPHGGGAFDLTRALKGRILRLEEHVERLYRALRFDLPTPQADMVRITHEVLSRNLHLLEEGRPPGPPAHLLLSEEGEGDG